MKISSAGRVAANAAFIRGLAGSHRYARFATPAVCGILSLAGTMQAWAEDTDFAPAPAFRSQQGYVDLRAGLSYTDNVLLAPTNRTGDTLATAGIDIDYVRKGSKLDLDALGSLNWVDYLKHTYRSTTYGTMNGSAVWGHSTDVFQWVARDSFGQLAANPLAADTPTNIENVNYFTTGPTLNFAFGRAERLSLYGLYSNTTYQRSPFDSHSETGGVALAHELSSASNIGINVDTQSTQFQDHQVATDYKINSAFLTYESAISRTRLTADAGYAQLRFAGSTTGGPLLSVQLDRRISYSSTVYIREESDYSTAAQSLRSGISTTASIGAFAGSSTPDPFKQNTTRIGWNFDRARTSLSILASIDRQRYVEDTTLNQNGHSIEALVIRRLQPTMAVTFSVRRTNETYQNINADIVETLASVALSKSFNLLDLSVRYDWHHRAASGTSSSLLTDFDQNQLGVFFTYALAGHRLLP